MEYIELDCRVSPTEPGNEIVIAELGEIGFESFVENEQGLVAYIQKPEYTQEVINKLSKLDFGDAISFKFESKVIEDQNWNTEWEKNFQPLYVGDICYIRAPFHPADSSVKYEIVIEPKMSFGTGHHSTTALVMEAMMQIDFKGKTVLDMGSGTGILAILASKMGAAQIKAIDIEEWAYKNALENVDMNGASGIEVFQGGAEQIGDDVFDVILANINRNVLLEQMPTYTKALKDGGVLLLSGFLTEDKDIINKSAADNGLVFVSDDTNKNWVAARFEKK